MPVYYTKFVTDLCEIILAGNYDGLQHLHLQTGEGKREFAIQEGWIRNDSFFSESRRQVEEYLSGERKTFDIRVNPQGTEFQKRVWSELQRIPYGVIRSYKDVATALGNEKSGRAVGMANSKNPIPLIIPCHRVVAANGSLSGFAHGVAMKQRLLELEKSK